MTLMKHFFLIVAFFEAVHQVHGHARLVEPPSRGSAWRYGFKTPKDFNDNEGFCGGFQHQVLLGGKCGICGDPYDGERKHEAGGIYATATIVRDYTAGQIIDVTIDVTANHDGWFYFKLCPNNDFNSSPNQDCFDENPLLLEGGESRFYLPDRDTKKYNMKVKLPEGITCSQCILQWTYRTANTWGTDLDGTSCVGCGDQETFRGCADISIGEGGSDPGTISPSGAPTWQTTSKEPDQTTQMPSSPSSQAPSPPTTRPSGKTCRGAGDFQGSHDGWCQANCNSSPPNCPQEYCVCTDDLQKFTGASEPVFKATGPWIGQSAMDYWCKTNCQLDNYPPSHCKCT